MANPNIVTIKDISGRQTEVALDVKDYMEAADKKLSLSQLYARKYPTSNTKATAFEQMIASANIRLRADTTRGIPASNMKEIFHGTPDISFGAITRDSGDNRFTPAGRILFPEIMIQMINGYMVENKDIYLNPWESAIAMRTAVNGPRVDQPTIDKRGPEGSAAQPISQLAEPSTMITITLNQRTYTIPTKSIGLTIADEALQATTIDLVGITLAAQARGERIRRIEQDMSNIIMGDTDFGINPVTFVNASTFDVLGGAKLTHRAWIKWLRANYLTMSISHIIGDIDAALDIDQRTGRPQAFGDISMQDNRLPGDFSMLDAGIPKPVFLPLPTSIIGADRLVAFDRNSALHQISNTSASYSAIEQFVMRRAQAMRFDFGIALVKLQDEAFQGLTLGA